MNRWARGGAAALLLALAAGCCEGDAALELEPTGRGRLTLRLRLAPDARQRAAQGLQTLRALGLSQGSWLGELADALAREPNRDLGAALSDPARLRPLAARFGPEVTLEEARRTRRTNGVEDIYIAYRFPDIRRVRLPVGDPARGEVWRFVYQSGRPNVLTARPPRLAAAAESRADWADQAFAFMHQQFSGGTQPFAGLTLRAWLKPRGRLLRFTAGLRPQGDQALAAQLDGNRLPAEVVPALLRAADWPDVLALRERAGAGLLLPAGDQPLTIVFQ